MSGIRTQFAVSLVAPPRPPLDFGSDKSSSSSSEMSADEEED